MHTFPEDLVGHEEKTWQGGWELHNKASWAPFSMARVPTHSSSLEWPTIPAAQLVRTVPSLLLLCIVLCWELLQLDPHPWCLPDSLTLLVSISLSTSTNSNSFQVGNLAFEWVLPLLFHSTCVCFILPWIAHATDDKFKGGDCTLHSILYTFCLLYIPCIWWPSMVNMNRWMSGYLRFCQRAWRHLRGISETTNKISETGRFLWRHLALRRRKQLCSSSSWMAEVRCLWILWSPLTSCF